jgi:hypothetical protein
VNGPIKQGPGPIHKNGWRREEVWAEAGGGGRFGDDDIGDECYIAFYRKPSSDWHAEIGYYVSQDLVTEDSETGRVSYGIECCVTVYERENPDDDPRNEETDYDYGSALCFDTLDQAQAEAKRLALQDESYVFCV